MANFFTKYRRGITVFLIIVAVALIIWVLYWLRMFILPFAIGLAFAYLLRPVVRWLERHIPPRHKWPRFRRVAAVILSFLMLLILIGGFIYLVASAVVNAAVELVDSAPYFLSQSIYQVQQWIDNILAALPEEMQQSLSGDAIGTGFDIGQAISDFLKNAVPSLPSTINFLLGFAILPFFLFYILKDMELVNIRITTLFSEDINRHVKAILGILERVLGRYLRAQLMLGLIVGYFTFVGLLLLDIPFALALALLAGITELIPTLGPWIGGAVAGVVTLALEPEKTFWVIGLFVVIQALENNLLVPKIQSSYLGIHPALMLVLLIFGVYIAGFWGILLIGPLTAVLIQVGKYVKSCMYESSDNAPTKDIGQGVQLPQ